MAQSAADQQSWLADNSSGSAWVLSMTQGLYLKTVRTLLAASQRASGVKQKQIFVEMMHAFMQELCGYPSTTYRVTTEACNNPEADSSPHVVPTSYSANSTLFYFTSSADPDDVHDLWVKHAQVYLATPQQRDVAAECATQVVFTNFFIIDGASKDPKTDAWDLWSISDIEAAQGTRIDLRMLENETALAPTLSRVIHKRLQTMQYHISTDVRRPDSRGSEALADLMPKMSMEGHGA